MRGRPDRACLRTNIAAHQPASRGRLKHRVYFMHAQYLETLEHYINGAWVQPTSGRHQDVMNPSTNTSLGKLGHASKADLDSALAAAQSGFGTWRRVSAFERCKIMRKAADLVRSRADRIANILTFEQGKLLAEAKMEVLGSADIIEWFAEEGRRAYGRIIPARADGVRNMVMMEPVGPVAGFSPWNFPVVQASRKIGAALAAGCSIIVKCPEETPGSPIEFVKCFEEAGVPAGVINLIYGVPAEISEYLTSSPIIRKISFTGSVPVGKQLGSLAGLHMKRATMELGGHAPVLVFDDVETDSVATLLAGMKYRNAGQVCVSPTRFFVQEKVYDKFVAKFTDLARDIKVGDGFDPASKMGPLANPRRVNAMESILLDAQEKGAKAETGGKRIGNEGNFFEPTVLTNVPENARIMHEEPFGPIAVMLRFKETEDVLERANSLPFGLASYAFTKDAKTATRVSDALDHGMVSINHFGIALPETPFGGVKDSGYGHEGGIEGLNAYLQTKFVSHLG